MSLLQCVAKLQRDLRDFDTSDVREAAKAYKSRGREDKAANVAAIEDHLRELRQARQSVVDTVLDEWKRRDPQGYANAARPALDLKGETEGEVRTREAQEAKAAEQERRVANAPSEKGFTLTGSDRPADEAEARGQKAMFSRGKTPLPYDKQVETPAFKRWFGASKAVDEHGKPLRLYHGTTNDFSIFDSSRANAESDFGAGLYFSNRPEDVAANYAGMGPDLTNKIEHHAERIFNDIVDEREIEHPQYGSDEYNKIMGEARQRAREQFAEHEGATMPVYLSIKKPFEVGGPHETRLTYDYREKRDGDIVEKGTLLKFVEKLRDEASRHDDGDVEPVIETIMQRAMDYGEISASQLTEILKADEHFGYFTGPEGALTSHEILRSALEAAGFDGVIDHTVNQKFGSERRVGKQMEGMDYGTVHYIAFRPEQVKSAIGNSGKFDKRNPDIRMARGETGAGMSKADVEKVLAPLKDKTKTPVDVVQSIDDIRQKRGLEDTPDDAKAVYHQGKITAIADNLEHALDVERTVARHEITHAGIDRLYGDSHTREVALTKVVAANPKVREIARAWREQYGDEALKQAKAAGLSDAAAAREVRLTSFEEGLAHFAEDGNEIRNWQQFVAVIQKGLRAMGFDRVADWLEHATSAEAMSLLDEARRATREDSLPVGEGRLQPSFHRAYHGSPHDFDKFSSEHIGKGEGNQAYGHGLYFAGRKEVADYYRSHLSASSDHMRVYLKSGKELEANTPERHAASLLYFNDLREMRALGKKWLKEAEDGTSSGTNDVAEKAGMKPAEYWGRVNDFMKTHTRRDIEVRKGRLYEVELSPKEEEYLDWDAKIGKQNEAVRDVARALLQEDGYLREGEDGPRQLDAAWRAWKQAHAGFAENDGEALYAALTKRVGSQQAASEYLAAHGVPGIRYLDNASRAKGSGYRNYVVFDDKHVSVTAKYARSAKVASTDTLKDDVKALAEKVADLRKRGASPEEINRATKELERKTDQMQQMAANSRNAKVAAREAQEEPAGPIHRLGDAIAKVFAPATRGEAAKEMAGVMRSNFAKQARDRELGERQLRAYAKKFEKMSPEENYKVIDAIEHGKALDDPNMQTAAIAMRKLLDERRDQVIALGNGKLEHFYENYFPHIWKDPGAAKTFFGKFFGRRPLQGSKAFLKQRSFDTFREGLNAGLEPVTSNPVELTLLKAREMDRYIYGQKIFEEMKGAGLAKFVKFGQKAPDGWTKINDSIARVYTPTEQGTVIRGEYYAPEQAATLINNHLSPGFRGNAIFDMWRGAGNAMNAAQLGLGAFHLGFTTLDAVTSRVTLGYKQMSRLEGGEVARGAGNVIAGLMPWQAMRNLMRGDKLLKAYLGDMRDPTMAPIVEALIEGGGRARMDPFYRVQETHNLREAVKLGRYVEAAKMLPGRLADALNYPIFEYLVPRQKLGVFFDMAQDAIRRNPDMTLEEKRATFGKLWDSVDNRLGEMVYDNLFWNRAVKDTLMAATRSVGWNLGTIRELGGGVKDIKGTFKRGELSDRTAYILGLTTTAGMLGAIIQYAYTGQGPQNARDLFFPRTGRKRPDGSDDRLSLPSYMKDIYEYAHDPVQTVKNKTNPLLSTVAQMLDNKDFYGAAIASPGDPALVRWEDRLKYLAKQVTPFGIRNYVQQSKVRKEEPTLLGYITSGQFYGLTPAPGYIVHTPEQEESIDIGRNRDAQVKKFRQALKDGTPFPEVSQRMRAAGMSQRDIDYVRHTSGDTFRQHPLKHYQPSE